MIELALVGGGVVAGVLAAAWRLKGEDGLGSALMVVVMGGPRPTVPK